MTYASEIVIFHYHLRSGGVTSVILLSIRAIAEELAEVRRVRLVAGEEPGGKLRESLASIASSRPGLGVELEIVPELGYIDPERSEPAAVGAIERLLLKRWGGALWWVHNYHLGKNPPFTQALLSVAAKRSDQEILLQIHDLPEAGRFENLRDLDRSVSLTLYPALANVRYAVINGHDRALLVDAGLPGEAVFLLGNPVASEGLPEVDAGEIRSRLAARFGRLFPSFDPAAPLLLYPVRAIRRKNVYEAALLAELSPDRPNLIVTLPGVSPRERAYSRSLEGAFTRGELKGLFGVGERLGEAGIDFSALAAAADRIVSSSVQEGFGYLFADSLRWRKPVVARTLATLEGVADLLEPAASRLYDSLLVPLAGRERERLISAYDRRLDRIEGSLVAPPEARDQIHELLSARSIDFSYLPPESQARLAAAARDTGIGSELRALNPRLFDGIERLQAPTARAAQRVMERFGFPAYAAALRGLITSFGRTLPTARADGREVQRRLRAALETPENLRLLLATEP